MSEVLLNDQKSSWAITQSGTGYPKLWEFANSSIFVRNTLAQFCTVSSTVLCLHSSGHGYFYEQRYRHSHNKCVQLLSSLNLRNADYEVTSERQEHFELR